MPPVDVLDRLLAPTGLDVEVDVGIALAHRRQEPLEQQPHAHGVDVGDAQRVADRGVRGRSATLAEDVGATAELHDVVDDQEVAGEVALLDDRQLALDHLVGDRVLRVAAVAPRQPAVGQLPQPARLGMPRRHVERRQVGRHQLDPERALHPERGRPCHRPRMVVLEALRHLRSRAQVRGAGRRQPPVDLVEAAPGPHRRQRRGQREPLGGGVVRGRGGDRGQPGVGGEVGQRVVPLGVGGQAVVGELDGHVLGAEQLDEPAQLPRGRLRTAAAQRLRHRALPAAGQHQHLARGLGDHLVQVVDRAALLPPRSCAADTVRHSAR